MANQGARGKARRRNAAGRATVDGVTLIELLIAIVVLAILIALATPSFISIMNNNRLTSHANEIVASLQQARMEAVRRNARITVCRTTDGTTCADAGAWTAWLTVVAANGEVLRSDQVKAPVQVTSPLASITFSSDGLAYNAGALVANDITVCIPTTRPVENRRIVSMGSGSRVSTSRASGDGACP